MSALTPRSKPGKPAFCGDCGHRFPQDPCFAVPCPNCGAPAGTYCRRPSGHGGPFVDFHRERDLAADAAGHYRHVCKP